jgi:multidrug efflux pump subunit AcrA (membrane-fusion protein)
MNDKQRRLCRFWAAAIAVAILSAGFYYRPVSAQAPGLSSAKKAQPVPVPSAAPVKQQEVVYRVVTDQVVRELILTGELRPARSVVINAPNIRSSFANMITYLALEGANIKQGERIVEFDDSSLLSQKSEAERTLDEAKLTIEKTKADLEAQRCDLLNSIAQAQADLDVAQLYAKIGKELLPGNTYQQYQLNLEKAKLSLQKAKEQMDNFEKTYSSQMALVEINKSQAEINLKKIESDMALLKIDAPQDGILVYGDNWQSNRKMQPGDNVYQGMEVASLPDLSSTQVVGYVYDTEYGLLQRDMRCTMTLDALPGYQMSGRIESLTSVASRKGFASQKKVFQAVIQPDKVDTALMKPGMTARVRIPIVLAKDVTAVPREYLGNDSQGRYYVFKGTENKTASVQYVQVGAIGDRLVQIVSGVQSGDPLIALHTAEVLK